MSYVSFCLFLKPNSEQTRPCLRTCLLRRMSVRQALLTDLLTAAHVVTPDPAITDLLTAAHVVPAGPAHEPAYCGACRIRALLMLLLLLSCDTITVQSLMIVS